MLPMFTSGGLASGDPFRDNDWLNCRSFDLLAQLAWEDHGQFPLRSHLIGGGFPTVAHPSDGSWAPTMLAILLLGDVVGLKLNLLMALLVGCWGVHGLASRYMKLSPWGSAFSALLFGFSGWFPSVLLVGSYHKFVYLFVPGALLMLLRGRESPVFLLWAGLLFAFILQQGSFGFPAIVLMTGIWLWVEAADESARQQTSGWARLGPLVLMLLVLLGLLAVAMDLYLSAHLEGVVEHTKALARTALPGVLACFLAGVWWWKPARLGSFVRALLPWSKRYLLVLAIALLLGAGKITGLVYLGDHGAHYSHGADQIGVALLPGSPAAEDELEMIGVALDDSQWGGPQAITFDPQLGTVETPDDFYSSPLHFLRALASRVSESDPDHVGDDQGSTASLSEFGWLGLSWFLLPFVLLGLLRPGPKRAATAAVGLLAVGWAFGPFLPLDLRKLLTGGLPFLSSVGQPIKYVSFFVLLPAVLLAGAGLDGSARMLRPSLQPIFRIAAFCLLLLPFFQNRTAFRELFAHPVSTESPADGGQLMQLGDPDWLAHPLSAIRKRSDLLYLREFGRQYGASEYVNARAGVGVIDWYGTVILPEVAIPALFMLPDGRTIPNPEYSGEAWVAEGAGEIQSLDVSPNIITLTATTPGPATIVINQSWLHGFDADYGTLVPVQPSGSPASGQGLIGLQIPAAGVHDVTLHYRPKLLIGGLLVSGASLGAWSLAMLWLVTRRRRQTPTHQAPRTGADDG